MSKIKKITDVCMTGGMHYTPSHTNVCKFYNFQLTFSQLIFHLKCWNLAGLQKLRCSFYCWYLFLRATASKYGESHDSSENSDFFLLRQKDPFGELFSEMYFQSSSEFTFLWNLGKFEIQLNQPRWPMEFIQNCTFSTRQYRKKGTCLDFIFTQFVIYSMVILLS